MTPLRVLRLALLVAGACLLDSIPALGAQLSAGAFRTQADQICAAAQKKLNAIPKPEVARQLAPYIARNLAAVAPSLDALRRLEPPASLRTPAIRYVTLQAQQEGVLQDLLSRMRRGADPVKSWNAIQPDLRARQAKLMAVSHTIGFRVCGVSGG